MWTVYSECLITDKTARIFKSEKLTGYDLSPVTISGIESNWKSDNDVPQFWELQLRGWAGIAKPESGIRLLNFCKHCGLSSYRDFDNPAQLIDQSQWDGSDFFMVWPLPRFVFVTEKVKNIIQSEKLTGCKLIPVEELLHSTDEDKVGTLSPGRLKRWMPEERARKLGEPLGIY
jgi:hypothetical protein